MTQTGRSRAERLSAPEFAARPDVAGMSVLVVDDVVTTGATLHAARDALLQQGSRDVVLAAVASTPAPSTARSRGKVMPFRQLTADSTAA